jgi:glutathione peroxidase
MNFYDFEAINIHGQKQSMTEYKDKVVVVVNTASKCGLTPQFKDLELLYKKYKDQGLVILGFPCNQFAQQEPGESKDIKEFCELNYGVSFPMFSKIDVNGDNAHPLYKYLKSKKSGWFGSSIKWNFTKFVIDRNGVPVKRFPPITKPAKMEALIKKLLKAGM